jgi:hypothetical protein
MDEVDHPETVNAAPRALGAAFFAASTLILIRELTVVSGGSETAVVVGVGASLGWTALGAALSWRLAPRGGTTWRAVLLAALPVLFAVEFWAVRGPAATLASLLGAPAVPWGHAPAACAVTAPVGLACGLLVAGSFRGRAGCARFWTTAGAGLAAGAAAVALGSALDCGPLCAAAVLCGGFAPLVSAAVGPRLLRRAKLALGVWTLAVAGAALVAGATPLCRDWQLSTAARGAPLGEAGAKVTAEAETPLGRLVVLRGEGHSASVRRNGLVAARIPDGYARDDAIFACGQADALGKVLVVGEARPELVRELILRGAFQIEVLAPDRALADALLPHLPERDREAWSSERVKRRWGNLPRLLRRTEGRFDLVLLSAPAPLSAAAAQFHSQEFLLSLAGRVAVRGTLVICVPGEPRAGTEYLARTYAALRELNVLRTTGGRRLLGLTGVFPAGKYRLAAARGIDLCETADAAAKRYRGHRTPEGTEPAAAADEDFRRLVNSAAARRLTENLRKRWESAEVVRESVRTPWIRLDYFLGLMRRRAPRSAAALGALMRTPVLGLFPVLLVLLVAGWLIARRTRGRVPGRFAILSAAAASGLALVAALDLSCTSYAAQSGALHGAVPLLTAALCTGLGIGALLGRRVPGFAAGSPRRALLSVQFGFLLVLFLGSQVVNLPPGSAWADLAHGTGLASLGLLAGIELVGLSSCLTQKDGPHRAAGGLVAAGGLGALVAAVLAGSMFLAVLGPASAFLLLVAVKVLVIGLLAAGAGRRKSKSGSSTSLPAPTVPPLPGAGRS